MELSFEVPDDGFDTFVREKIDKLSSSSSSCQLTEDSDIIDSSKLSFGDDENWLCESSSKSFTDLQSFLYDLSPSDVCSPIPSIPKSSPKNIDTRTFTRPKKRFTRPSIEKYNEELYGANNDLKELMDSGIQLNGCSQDDSPVKSEKPLHFDLGQTSASGYFETMLANAPVMDSFTNMSPPSLVNSMCSSTFQNLMESSFIKNDPVLREIRDTDFTGSILQQEVEPMFHSITESYSSLNSDVPENFLKKVSFTEEDGNADDSGSRTIIASQDDTICNTTVTVDDCGQDSHETKAATNHIELNSTYQRSTRPEPPLNSTFQRRKNATITRDLNSTITVEPERHDRTFDNVKRLLDRRPSPSLDLNRLSYVIDKNDQMNATFTATESPKRNSFGSTDSGENLDYMSLSSSSTNSRSSKMHSTDGINIIIDSNKQPGNTSFTKNFPDLQQVMSTPKPRNNKTPLLWSHHEISPIRDRNSDPELSSSEQPKTVIPQNSIRKQKSVGQINQKIPKGVNSLSQFDTKTAIRGSHPNLKMAESKTYVLQRQSNLNSMGHTLKGSYTSLKPMNTNLPVAPPPLDTTVTVKTPAVAQVSPLPREAPKNQDAQFVRPHPPRSNLPRPMTGIPRPVSRIPGPKSVRPVSKSAGLQGRH